ncbi:unnamed protein product [Cylindrotheca closterium]|uniref:Uncharacterized protein n=1 Tax=Cylindrotheca closterium TaxID=2856 RepID=A0AAD2FDR0_9STRA|nr:unnamed protein product [Cylindrotheca closterium]
MMFFSSSCFTLLSIVQLSVISGFAPIHHVPVSPTSCSSSSAALHMASPPPPPPPPPQEPPMMPALNDKEIREILDQIPVYGLISKETGSLFLVDDDTQVAQEGEREEDVVPPTSNGKKTIANFYLSPEFCQALVAGNEDQLEVGVYRLGQVYFDYYQKESKAATTTTTTTMEYRIIPDARNVQQARSILSQMAGIQNAFSSSPLQKEGYVEIPIFMDQHLRLAEELGDSDEDYREIFPMYFGWNDLVTTCQEYVKGMKDAGMDEEEYEAAISVAELHQLVAEMRRESPIDFRNVQFVPASPRPLDEEGAKTE